MINPLDKYIPRDKQYHLAAGAAVSFVVLAFGAPIQIAPLCALAAGLGKEAYDAVVNRIDAAAGLPLEHDVELLDVVYTFLGGLLVSIAAVIV